MFDCVLPTRNGRHGLAFTRRGPINLKNARHADDPRPLDEAKPCPAARDYSRAYLHHLVKAGEMLGAIAALDGQSLLLSGADGGRARRDRGRPVRGVPRADPGGLGARRSSAAVRCECGRRNGLDGRRRGDAKCAQSQPMTATAALHARTAMAISLKVNGGRALGSGRAGHAAALRAAQRSRAQRRQVRLRAGAMRRLHGAGRRRGDALLRHPDRRRRQAGDHHHRGARHASRSRIRCSRPSSTSRRRSAATASTA